jgi:hypothetical protein
MFAFLWQTTLGQSHLEYMATQSFGHSSRTPLVQLMAVTYIVPLLHVSVHFTETTRGLFHRTASSHVHSTLTSYTHIRAGRDLRLMHAYLRPRIPWISLYQRASITLLTLDFHLATDCSHRIAGYDTISLNGAVQANGIIMF